MCPVKNLVKNLVEEVGFLKRSNLPVELGDPGFEECSQLATIHQLAVRACVAVLSRRSRCRCSLFGFLWLAPMAS